MALAPSAKSALEYIGGDCAIFAVMVGHKVRAQLFKSFMHTTKHAALLIRQETESSNVVTVDSSALTAFELSPDKAWTSPMNGGSWHIDGDRFWTRISLSGVSVPFLPPGVLL